MSSLCVVFLFLATPNKHKVYVLCLQNVSPYICEMILKMFTNIKTFNPKIIAIIFLIIFEFLFSQHFEIQYCKNYSLNISEKYFYIMIERYSLTLRSLA